MSDTPFWERDDNDEAHGDTPAPEPPAADDDAPDTITVGEHTFVWTEGVRAEVHLHDQDGGELGTAHIPYDPDNQPSEEEVFAQADKTLAGLEHMRSILKDDVVRDLARDIETSGTADLIVQSVVDAFRGNLKISVTADDDEPPHVIAEMETVAKEAERLVDDNLDMLVRETARGISTPEGEPGRFWRDLARDILAHAMLWARTEIEESLDEHLDDIEDAEFERLVLETYHNGPHVTQAMLTLWPVWTGTLAEIVGKALEAEGEGPDAPSALDTLMDSARRSLAKKGATAELHAPAFTADGRGHVMTDLVSIGGRKSLIARKLWTTDASKHPVFAYSNSDGKALYAPAKTYFPTPADAWKAVEGYGDAHVGLLRYISAKYMANKADGTTGPYGGFYVSVREFLDARGLQKHARGGHRPEYTAETVAVLNDLARIEVRGHMSGYAKGKRGKKQELIIDAPLIVVSHTVKRRALNGHEVPVGWYLRPGDWAVELEKLSPKYGIMYRSILRLNTQNDVNAWRIANTLIEEYRIRAREQNWTQPYRVETLLAGACIEIDRKHAKRFRDRIEAALDVLANPDAMEGAPLIASWKYPRPIAATGRGWFDRWLASGIVILPPNALKDPYQKIGERKRRPRKLASGQA